MNTKLFYGLSVLGLMAVGIYAANQSVSEILSDEMKANVEALANGEIYVDYDKNCVDGDRICITGGQNVYYNARGTGAF